MRSIWIILALLSVNMAWGKSVEVKTGRHFIDTKRTVVLDQFDYIYQIGKIHCRGMIIELVDGTQWKVEPIGQESSSFYKQRKPPLAFDFVENAVQDWLPGERLIFHKVTNKYTTQLLDKMNLIEDHEHILVYNLDRDQLFDVSSFLPPLDPLLTLSFIDRGQKLITLSDGSTWRFDHSIDCPLSWDKGDPIMVAKNTPWRKKHTHLLLNIGVCKCDSTVEHIHPNRIGVVKYEKQEKQEYDDN